MRLIDFRYAQGFTTARKIAASIIRDFIHDAPDALAARALADSRGLRDP
jgi:hypothetical protein